jgi:hypothetical protein
VALSGRAAARDLYDLNNMVCFGLFDESERSLLRKCAVLYLAVSGDTKMRGFDFAKLGNITERMVKTDLFPMIRREERFDFPAAKERVSAFLSELLVLPENEKTFLEHFANGHYEPELLFDDKAILDRVTNHPMAKWRIDRIKRERRER